MDPVQPVAPAGPADPEAHPGSLTAGATWRRFTWIVAALAGLALIVGLALSYASVYRVAYHAGFHTIWIDARGWQLRPAHLFPLTLDVPVLVGYAGTIALAGRRSVAWARIVLISCAVATVAAQVVDGADLITEHDWIKAVIHGWPPALAVLTAHLLVKILQALGFLIPPVAETERPSWPARTWTWVCQLVADMRSARRALDRGDMDRDTEQDTDPDAEDDTPPDTGADTGGDTKGDNPPDTEQDNPMVKSTVIPLTARQKRIALAVISGSMTQAEAARRASVTTRTIGRWVKTARDAQHNPAS